MTQPNDTELKITNIAGTICKVHWKNGISTSEYEIEWPDDTSFRKDMTLLFPQALPANKRMNFGGNKHYNKEEQLQLVKSLGMRIFSSLFPKEHQKLWNNQPQKIFLDLPFWIPFDIACHPTKGFVAFETPLIHNSVESKRGQKIELPLRILVVISSPKESGRVFYENEQVKLLHLMQQLQGKVEFVILREATVEKFSEQVQSFQPHVIYLSGHGGADAAGGRFVFEGRYGEKVLVGADKLRAILEQAKQLQLLYFSACQCALQNDQSSGLAYQLTDLVPCIIAMRESILDISATALGCAFFENLLSGESPAMAITKARKQIQEDPQWSLAVVIGHNATVPFVPKGEIPQTISYSQEAFIGRREEIWQMRRKMDKKGVRGFIIEGAGGVGKSTLATQMSIDCGVAIIEINSEISAESIFQILYTQAKQMQIELPEINADMEIALQVAVIAETIISQQNIAIIFHDFEDNLPRECLGNSHHLSLSLQQALLALVTVFSKSKSLLFITCRYSIPLEHKSLHQIKLHELPQNEALYKMLLLPALQKLPHETLYHIHQFLGGNPRSIENLDAWLTNDCGTPQELLALITEIEQFENTPKQKKEILTNIEEYLQLPIKKQLKKIAENKILSDLVNRLNKDEQQLLKRISLYQDWFWGDGIHFHVRNMFPNETTKWQKFYQNFVTKTDKLNLLQKKTAYVLDIDSPIESENKMYVPRDTMYFLANKVIANYEKKQAHQICATYHEWKCKNDDHNLLDLIYAHEHYIAAQDCDNVKKLSDTIYDCLDRWGHRNLAMEILQKEYNLAKSQKDEEFKSTVLIRMGIVHRLQGRYEDAIESYQQALSIFEKIGDIAGISQIHGNMGNVHQEQGRYKDAIESYQQALSIFEKIGDIAGISQIHINMGNVHRLQGRYEDAIESYQQALSIFEKIGDIAGISQIHQNMGGVHQLQGRYEDAIESYQQSLSIFEKIGDIAGISQIHQNMGNVHQLQGRYEDAIESYQQALSIFEKIGDIAGISQIHLNMGIVHRLQGRYEDAIESYQQALSIFEKIGDIAGISQIHINMGAVHQLQGRYEDAIESYQQALSIFEKIGDIAGISQIHINMGAVHQSQGRYEDAIESYQQALSIFEKIGDIAGISQIHQNMGIVHRSQGRYEDAIESYQQALSIFEKIGDIAGISQIHLNMGIVHRSQGRYEDAIESYQQALSIFEKIGDIAGISQIHINMGAVHRSQGRYEDAIESYQQALSIKEKIGDIAGISQIHQNMGVVHQSQGRYEEAIESYQQALSIFEKIGDIAGISQIHQNMGVVHQSQGRYEEAIESYQQALSIFEKIGDIAGISAIHLNMGGVHCRQGRYEEAIESYQQALSIKEKIGDIAGISNIHQNMGGVHQSQGRYEEAIESYQQALSIFEKIGDIAGISAIHLNMGVVYQSQGRYEEAIESYQQALSIKEKIGDIAGICRVYAGIGLIYKQHKMPEANQYFEAALELAQKLQSPPLIQTIQNIMQSENQ